MITGINISDRHGKSYAGFLLKVWDDNVTNIITSGLFFVEVKNCKKYLTLK